VPAMREQASEFLKDVIALLSPNSPPNIHPLCGTSLGIKAYKRQRDKDIATQRLFVLHRNCQFTKPASMRLGTISTAHAITDALMCADV
jgi:hypothetical protein